MSMDCIGNIWSQQHNSVYVPIILKELTSNSTRNVRFVKADIEVSTRTFFQSYRNRKAPKTIQLASDALPLSQGV